MQLFRGFKSRGHCPAELRLLFKEVSEKLANKHEIEEVVGNKTVSLKLNLNLKRAEDTKDERQIILSRQ